MILPEQVQIQTIDFCNRACVFCPNSKMKKSPASLMSINIFEKILDDFKAVDFKGRFHLYLMAEPLCDSRIIELIKLTRKRFKDNIIFISTNGDGLKGKQDIDSLFDAGLSWLSISHYDNRNSHLKNCIDSRVQHADISDLRHTFYNRAGLVNNVACIGPDKKCRWLWSKAFINWRGDVILCCSDYHYEVKFGNVMESDFATIFNSAPYNAYRKAHDDGDWGHLLLCRDCNRVSLRRVAKP